MGVLDAKVASRQHERDKELGLMQWGKGRFTHQNSALWIEIDHHIITQLIKQSFNSCPTRLC